MLASNLTAALLRIATVHDMPRFTGTSALPGNALPLTGLERGQTDPASYDQL